MSNYLKDNLALPNGKAQYQVADPRVPANKQLSADDWNNLCQAVEDIRAVIRALAPVYDSGKWLVDANGKVTQQYTDASGTPGNATINKPKGRVAVAAGASSVVVTNSLCTTASHPSASMLDVTDDVSVAGCVPANGSFTIYLTGAVSAARAVFFRLED